MMLLNANSVGLIRMKLFRCFPLFLVFFLFQLGLAEDVRPNVTLLIPMRDGTELPTDLYYPENAEGQRLPCILIRCPPGRKTKPWQTYCSLAQSGYVVAIQDTRSSIDKEGKTLPFFSDGWNKEQDGYDTVEWLSKSMFTNGQVATFGFSAAGITQLMMAPSAPSSLKCQYIGMAWGSVYHHGIFPGGQALKSQIEGWLGFYARHPSVIEHVLSQPQFNAFWQNFDTLSVSHRVNVPGLLYTGWYDTALQGTIEAYLARQHKGAEGAKGRQKLIIGPWTHYWPMTMTLGDFTVPEHAQNTPIDISPVRWFDYHLKGIDNGIDKIPEVTYFVMGPMDGTPSTGNKWSHASAWPVPSEATHYYMSPDGKLTTVASEAIHEIAFIHNPESPVPTKGGRNLWLESGFKDQSEIEKRDDVLVFTTEPLEEDMEVTGHLKAVLYVSSDKKDTDFVVRLTDVYPDGRSMLIADGLTRTGHLKDIDTTQGPQKITVDLWSTSMVFAKGHRIRVSISGSNYPQYERNGELSNCKISLGGDYLSAIILPIVTH